MSGGLLSLIAYGVHDLIPYGRPTYYSYFRDEYYDKIYDKTFKPLEEYYINYSYDIKRKYNLPYHFNYCIDFNKYITYLDKIKELKTEKKKCILDIRDYNKFIRQFNYDYTINNVNRKIQLLKQLKKRYKIVSKELKLNKYEFNEFKQYSKNFINNIRNDCNKKYDSIVSEIEENDIKTEYIEYRNDMITKLKKDNMDEYTDFINDLNKNNVMKTERYLFEDDNYLYINNQ
jgi:hypothetical protein